MSGDERIPLNPQPGEPGKEGESAASPGPEGEGERRNLGKMALEEVMRPLAIAGMLTCIAISLVQFVTLLVPEWPGGVFVLLTFLACLESIHAQRLLSRSRIFTEDKVRFRLVEWVVILLVVRFAVYLEYGSARLVADLASWTMNIGSFFEGSFIVNSVLIALFWALALMLSQAMQELEITPIEKMPSITDPGHYLRTTMPHHGRVDRTARLQRITAIFFGGGVFLLILAGLSQVDIRDLVVFEHSRSSGIILNVLAYFLIGLLLISQAQYTILKANWELQGIPILGQMGRRWVLWGLGFLMLIGLVSALLPVSYSVGLMDALATALHWIIYVVVQSAFALLFVLSVVLGWILSLFSTRSGQSPAPMKRAAPPPPPPTVIREPNAWWLVARSLIFWTVIAGVVGYSLFHFARDRWGLFQGLSTARFFTWFRGLWQRFRVATHRVARRVRQEIARRLASRSMVEQRRWRFVSLRRLSPRDRVRYFYLSILRRSAQQGFGRAPAQTPLEYEEILSEEMPEASAQVDELTWGFIEAQYSEHSVVQDEATALRAAWRRVKRALTLRKRRG